MNAKLFKTIIKESIHDYIKEIDEAGDTAAMDAKITKCEEAITSREKKIEMSESLEEMKDMINPDKINELKKEIKDLQKAKAKFEKIKDKKANKGKKKEIVTDGENTEEASDMEATITDEALDSSNESLNESFVRMQKLAGIITEMKDMVDPNIINKAKNFIKSNHNPGEEEDHITYEYSLEEIDPEIVDLVDYIKKNKRLNVTVNGQSAAMTMKNNKIVVEFF
jgi:hypothetical protein